MLALALPARAEPAAPDCEALAAAAGREAGIPEGILPAIARVEAGRNGRAWPWTLNQGGAGSFQASKAEALARLDEILATGVRNVDLGCMQINWRWHSDAFADASAMMDPATNIRYAARFLVSLHERHGSWDRAVAAYHSSDATLGAVYGQKVALAREAILAEPPALVQLAGLSAQPVPRAQPVMTRGLLALTGQALVARGQARDLRTGRAPGFLGTGGGATP